MSYSVNINNHLATFQFEVSAENFAHELEKEIFRSKDKLNLSVYRDGKVPPEVMQQMYDRNELLKRVINTVIGDEFENAINELGIVSLTSPLAKVLNCQRGEPFIFTLETYIKPDINLSNYAGIKMGTMDASISNDDVEQVVQRLLQQNAVKKEITDRPVIEGDRVIIDFEGFLHGRAFRGNKAENFPLLIGSNSFIPGFEEEIIGVGLNEAKDFTITYPSDYRAENLAGQEVVFRCIVRGITQVELPELTDEFIKQHTKHESVTMYKESIRKSLMLQKRVIEMKKQESFVLKTIVESSSIEEIPVLEEQEKKKLNQELELQLKKSGTTFENHLKKLKMNKEQFEQHLQQLAQKRSQTRLVLLEIAKRENFDATEEELDKEIANLSKSMNKSESEFRHPFSKSQIINEIKIQKALRFVMSHAVEDAQIVM